MIECNLMVNIGASIIILLLVWQGIAPSAPSSSQIVCSSFCKPTSCNGWTASDCNNNCNTALGWTAQSGPCSVTSAGFQYLDSSDDAGGMISVSPNTYTSNCPNLTGYLGTQPYGDFTAGGTVNITLAGGTDVPHWAVDLIFVIILVDTDSGTSSKKWTGSPKFYGKLYLSNSTITKSFTMGGGNPTTTYTGFCGDTGKKDTYYQFQNTYSHNESSTDITFSITTDNSNSAAIWVAKEFIYDIRICSAACLSCNNTGTVNVCFSCDPGLGYMLNNYSCYTSCQSGFGYTDDPAMCVYCDLHCTSCYGIMDNCSACRTSGTWKSYLYYNDSLGYETCVNPCPDGYFANSTSNTCDLCDPVCATCKTNSSYCYSCIATYGWTGYYCYYPCPDGYYSSNSTNNCTKCNVTCITCTDQVTCQSCTLNGTNTAYLLGVLCYANCPAGYYNDNNFGLGPNTCIACASTCATCTSNPSPCQSCKNGSYLYNYTCGSTCPNGTIAYAAMNQCLDCSTYCVDVTINPYFPTTLCDYLYVDMTFTKALNFNNFSMSTFQTVTIEGVDAASYTLTYQNLSSTSYRIIVEPVGYIFLYNQTVTITTKSQPANLDTANDTTPFKPEAYSKSATINWFLLKSPTMSEGEKSVINNLGSINQVTAAATTAPFVAEVKKAGIMAMLFSGAQITTCSVFVNSIPSQNMYEAVRFWGIFVLYDVPAWEQNSKIPNNVLGVETHSIVKDQRLLFDMTTMYWRYQRTGQSSFFLYDVYIPLLLIATCWILALVANIMRRSDKNAFKAFQSKYFTILHKLHEAAILYVTMAMMMEWMYFDAGSGERWMSFLVCLAFTIYFVSYELYIYYDMIKYPEAFIGNQRYEYYLNRYGSFLKNLRFEEYDLNEEWSPKHWFRPYNYHILSYYKKFCMIISLPIFYELTHFQPFVLLLLQIMQIVRFALTRPYYARWRNVFRFLLELFLLIFFLCVLINTYLIQQIMLNNADTLQFYVRFYYNVGWVGFVMVFAFNIGFLVIFGIDLVQGFRHSNRQLMEEARRVYYYDKITGYEREHEEVPLNLMNRWVKLGNLNKRNTEELPDINIRVEYFKLVRHNEYFDVEVLKIAELYLNTDLNYHRENNTTPGKKVRRKIKLSKETSRGIFALMNEIFAKYARKDTEAIIIKTFVHISQREFQAGDRIPLLPNEMFQKIELQNHTGEKEHIKLKEKLKGFPLNVHDLENI